MQQGRSKMQFLPILFGSCTARASVCHDCQTNVQMENRNFDACVRLNDVGVKCGKSLAGKGVSEYRLCVECERLRFQEHYDYYIHVPDDIHPILKIELYKIELNKRALYQRRHHLPFCYRHYKHECDIQEKIEKCLRQLKEESDTIWRL